MIEHKRLGYITSNTEAEDAFNKIKDELSKEKKDWTLINELLQSISLMIVSEELKDLSKVNIDSVILMFLLTCNNLVSEVGVELMETHERLAAVEKTVKDLKSRSK